MSYILKALKQAQESRNIDGTPVTAATQRLRVGERPRRIPWRWIAWAALALNGIALVLFGILPRFSSQAPAPPLPSATSSAPSLPPAPTVATATPAPAPAPAAVAPPAPTAAPRSGISSPPPPTAARPPAVPVTPPARVAAAPAPRPKPVEPVRQPAVASRAPEPTDRPGTGRAPSPPPPAPITAVAPPPQAVMPPPPVTSEVGPELRDAMEKFKFEVLVWAADPRDRMVFLSGRKFVEGQTLDGKVIVERINDDSITLAYQGQRVRLQRP